VRIGAALPVLAALVLTGTSAAAWSASIAGSGKAKAGSLVGNKPAAVKSGVVVISVALSWAPTPGASGYIVQRTGGIGSLGGTCTGTLAGTSCTDSPLVTLNTYSYTVTPVAGSWTGTRSAATVVNT
jgi:hypothetical protein